MAERCAVKLSSIVEALLAAEVAEVAACGGAVFLGFCRRGFLCGGGDDLESSSCGGSEDD